MNLIESEPAPEIIYYDDDPWCLERDDNPLMSLCGRRLMPFPCIPNREVTEDSCCPECWRIKNKL